MTSGVDEIGSGRKRLGNARVEVVVVVAVVVAVARDDSDATVVVIIAEAVIVEVVVITTVGALSTGLIAERMTGEQSVELCFGTGFTAFLVAVLLFVCNARSGSGLRGYRLFSQC